MLLRRAKLFTLPTVLLLLLLIGMGWVAVGFWGNPWVRLTMSGRVADYLGDRYPQTRFAVTSTNYDFLNRRYVVRVRSTTEPPVEAIVELYRTGIADDNYLQRKLEAEMRAQVTSVVQSVLPAATVSPGVILPDKSEYGEAVTYGPEVRAKLTVGISWHLSSPEPSPFVKQAMAVLAALRQSGLRVDECRFWGELGARSYALDLTNAEMAFTEEQLLPLVRRPGKW